MSKYWEEELSIFDHFVSYPEAKDYLRLKKKVALSIAKQRTQLLKEVREKVLVKGNTLPNCKCEDCQMIPTQLKKLKELEEGK